MIFSSPHRLVLASGSRYRRALLDQLRLSYTAHAPAIDEAPVAGELPVQTASRLARDKARALASRFPDSLIIGSDQVATLDGHTAFSKPESHADAVEQLRQMSARTACFYTAVCLFNAQTSSLRLAVVPTEVTYRALSIEVIEAYLQMDRPYDCAGSARIEGLGIALVSRVHSDDPSALLGLPMIALTDLLRTEGVQLP